MGGRDIYVFRCIELAYKGRRVVGSWLVDLVTFIHALMYRSTDINQSPTKSPLHASM